MSDDDMEGKLQVLDRRADCNKLAEAHSVTCIVASSDYGFEYSEEEQEEEDVDVENQYYNSKGEGWAVGCVYIGSTAQLETNVDQQIFSTGAGLLEADDPRDAIEGFNQVVNMEGDKGEWCACCQFLFACVRRPELNEHASAD